MGDVEILYCNCGIEEERKKNNEIIYTFREENNEMILSCMTFPKYEDIASYTIDSWFMFQLLTFTVEKINAIFIIIHPYK